MGANQMLTIRMLGKLAVERDGMPAELPTSRKTRALLAYLVLSTQPQSRQFLCELLWDIPDDPRGALRWSLSKLRPLLDDRDNPRLLADREWIALERGAMRVDVLELFERAESADADIKELTAIWEEASNQLLLDCELPNIEKFALWLDHQRRELDHARLKIARRLTLNRKCSSQDRVRWADRWLADCPFDPEAARHAVVARYEAGLRPQADQLAKELTDRFTSEGLDPPEFSTDEYTAREHASAEGLVAVSSPPRQTIRFLQASDGTSIAWASVGSSDNPPLVKAANWLSHLELDWEAPIWSPLFRELSNSFQFIRYDERGCGQSDWAVDDIDFESFVTDLELVVSAAGLERFPLLGISQGAAVSIEYAARHPERVSHLILFGGYAAGWRHIATQAEAREREAMMVLTETGWGRANPAYRRLFSQTFMPDATGEELEWFDEFQRRTTTPENAVRFLDAFAQIDVRDRLTDVQAPTLVVHSRGDQRVPMRSGQLLAARIPNSRFVSLDSRNHILLGREAASARFLDVVKQFLAEDAAMACVSPV